MQRQTFLQKDEAKRYLLLFRTRAVCVCSFVCKENLFRFSHGQRNSVLSSERGIAKSFDISRSRIFSLHKTGEKRTRSDQPRWFRRCKITIRGRNNNVPDGVVSVDLVLEDRVEKKIPPVFSEHVFGRRRATSLALDFFEILPWTTTTVCSQFSKGNS